ncbi:MAG: DUF5686 and carboxypeptidase regulatory-like domain-containing protein [Algoriphagus sp.]|nr:DUF5686 and carboxypeptidase regulatory-like domain-containing protein [Algoriphagus sp.]
MIRSFLIVFLLLFSISTYGQYSIRGKVTDAETGDPIAFANVILTGTTVGITTDFDGSYLIESRVIADSIKVSYLGYVAQSKALSKELSQTINFQLKSTAFELGTFVFESGENPAFEIIRRASAKRKDFDKRELTSYETKNYTKIELDVDNLSESFLRRKSVQSVTSVLDSIRQLTNDEGEKILPVFFSETVSRFYYRNNPELRKEIIEKTKVTGVGITDGSTTSQITGSVFQEYNFYKNWLRILEKDFISPIADGWKTYYDYDLLDSVLVGEDTCYKLQVYPRREQDLAFTGTIWIKKDDYALKQVDLTIPKAANLNFVERIKIQQELVPTAEGPLLPSKTRVLIKIGQISENTAGLLAKFYTATDSAVINQPKPTAFFNQAVELKPDFSQYPADFWASTRPEILSEEELAVLQMVDTLKKIPIVRFYSEGLKFFATGYLPIRKVDLGPWTEFGNYNNVEGLRLGFGLRSNYKFSNKWLLEGYGAYGLVDQRWKYKAAVTLILDRKRWTTLQVRTSRELDQVGLEMENLEGNSVFLAASRFGTLRRPFVSTNQRLTFQREFFKGFLLTSGLNLAQFDPLYNFYFLEKNTQELQSNFQTTELRAGIRYGRDEVIIINDNVRASLGSNRWPIVELNYAQGVQSLGGQISYTKLNFYLYQRLTMGIFGVGRYELDAGKVWGEVPYPVLKNHLGNETIFYTTAAFNTMNFNEFASDQFISLRYRQSFEGFLLNSIPVIKKLKWRMVGSANLLMGSVRDENIQNVPSFDPFGNPLTSFGRLDPTKPYLELGYGVENVFRFFRVDFFHRMSYLDNPGAKPFHVKVSAQIIL